MRRTPLHAAHVRLGGRMVEFAGWEMPVYYSGILDEHRAVRERVGLFDVSHMGEVEVRGPSALATCQRLFTNDVAKLVPGRAQYSAMCLPSGGIVDDVIYSRLEEDRFLVCVNASNADKDFAWIQGHAGDSEVTNRSDDFALLALQGPRAEKVLARLSDANLADQKSFSVVEAKVAGAPAIVSRTGYTGEDGFEIYVAPEHAETIWNELLAKGAADGILPVGLGARDTLRLEKALMLYGNDIDEQTSPLEAGLGWVVKLEKGDFVGRDALARQKAQGLERKLVGLRLDSGPPPRHGYRVMRQGEPVGVITSGTKSPTLGYGIALAMVSREASEAQDGLAVEIRSRQHPAEIVRLPFVAKNTSGGSR